MPSASTIERRGRGKRAMAGKPLTAAGGRMNASAKLACAFALLACGAIAHAQVYKCSNADGGTAYSDAPCTSGGKALKLPERENRGFGDATVCGQLLDETRRLAAEAGRDARRGRPKNVANAKRRQELVAQYERRCAGISRSAR
jgi:hypothetical protein